MAIDVRAIANTAYPVKAKLPAAEINGARNDLG
jgi:hypothetical protein